jgi:hypothetical protein
VKPRIFISHSTKTEEAEKFLLAVEAALADDYDVRLDMSGLKLGDDWRRTLYAWMDQAHGAVLLLTEAALKSSFVPIEASVLSWRHYRDPNFAFLPVFVDATGFAAVKRRPVFRALALDVLQITRVDSDDVAAAIGAIREALRRFQAQFPHPKTPFERLHFFLRRELERSRIDSFTLEQIGREVFLWTEPAPGDASAVLTVFAKSLLEAKRDVACQALWRLDRELVVQMRQVLCAVAPTWIEFESAAPIAETVFSAPPKPQILLETDQAFILNLYICRASCQPYSSRRCELIQILNLSMQDTAEDILRQIVVQLTAKFAPPSPEFSPATVDRVRGQLESYERGGVPVFLLFQSGYVPDAEIIEHLKREFPTLTICVLTRGVDPSDLVPLRKNATELVPLDFDEEWRIVDQYCALYKRFTCDES